VRRRLGGAVVVLVLAACGGGGDADSGIRVDDVWARTTPAGVTIGAVYLRATSDVDDELTGASVDPAIAGSVELHTTETSDDGTSSMTQQASLALPAGDELVLEPIGNHLMLVDLAAPLATGETFEMTLHFATAGDELVDVEVREGAP
jgi:copper(I)-binding protein